MWDLPAGGDEILHGLWSSDRRAWSARSPSNSAARCLRTLGRVSVRAYGAGYRSVVMAPSAPVVPAAPAPSKGSPVMKIVLIIVGVMMLLGMLLIGSCVYGVYRAKQRFKQFEKQVQANLPPSTGSSQAPIQPGEPGGSAVDTGVPAYPGAETPEGQTGVVLGMAGLKMQQYTTRDPVDKVVAFYKDKLGPNAVVTQSGDQASVHLVGSNSVVNVAIAVDSASGKTKIVITSIGKP